MFGIVGIMRRSKDEGFDGLSRGEAVLFGQNTTFAHLVRRQENHKGRDRDCKSNTIVGLEIGIFARHILGHIITTVCFLCLNYFASTIHIFLLMEYIIL